jgi:hypothetical protein
MGVEIDPHYRKMASDRIARETQGLFSKVTLQLHGD